MGNSMDMKLWQDKAKILIESLPYIQQFRGKIIVIKYGGSAMLDKNLKKSLMRDIALLQSIGFKPIIVHGGGKEIDKWLQIVGIQREFKNADGQYEADFIPVVLWSNSAEVAGNNLSKGKKILVEGRLQTRSYVDKQNVTRWVTELVGRYFEYMYSNPSPQQKFDEEFENPFEGVPMPDMDNIPF